MVNTFCSKEHTHQDTIVKQVHTPPYRERLLVQLNLAIAMVVRLGSSPMQVGLRVRAADQDTFQTRWPENASRVRLAVTLKKEQRNADHVQQGHTVMLWHRNAPSVHLVPFPMEDHLNVNIAVPMATSLSEVPPRLPRV